MGKASIFDIRLTATMLADAGRKLSTRKQVYTKGYQKDYKWTMLMPFFRAHEIGKWESNYVQSVKYAQRAGIFISSTSSGEVKLWSVGKDYTDCCLPLGKLNSKDWDGKKMLSYLSSQDPSIKDKIVEESDLEVEDAEGE
jgi:hypothetical protein